YYKEVKEKARTYYEVYSLQRTEEVPEDYKEISFVCLRADGAYEAPSTVGIMCRAAKKKVKGLEDFHFHTLRHTYTSNLLSGGAKPKDVQELLGHSDVSCRATLSGSQKHHFIIANFSRKKAQSHLNDTVMPLFLHSFSSVPGY